MITNFRNFAKSPWAIGLVGLIMLSFVIVGTQTDALAGFGSRNVISAGARSVGVQEFTADFGRTRDNYQQQSGQAVSYEDMVQAGLHQRYLEERTLQLGFLDWAWSVGIRPGRELVLKQMRQMPAFFNQVTAQFDEQAYRTVLAQANVTPKMFEDYLRDQYVETHYRAALAAGPYMPRIYGALVANQGLETRDGRWFTVTQAMAGTAPAPTDAQLTAFLNENADQLRRPELRTLSVVLFTGGAAPAPTEAQIREKFDFRKESLSTPERRTFVVLSAPDRAAADRIAAALRAGQTPAEAGRAAGVEPANYADTPRAAVSDPAVAEAVFALASGAVSDPVQARVGFAVAQVTSVTPGREARLEDSREAIITELNNEAAHKRVSDFMALQTQGRSLEDAAREVGARIITLGPVSQDGVTAQGRINPPPQLLTTAWSLQKGEESEVIDAGGGQYFALRVDEITPAALPSLDQVRGVLTVQWTRRENSRLLSAKSEELAGRVRAGEDIVAVAASVGAPLTVRTGLEQNQETQTAVGEGVMRGVFSQERGQAFSMPASETSYVIGRVDAINAPTIAAAAPIANQVRPRMVEGLFGSLAEQTAVAARDRRGARYDLDLAVRSLGVTAPASTPAPTPAQ